MAKTAAQRMKEYRARVKASAEPETVRQAMIAAYEQGYADALKRLPPNPPAGANLAMSYVLGGLDSQ
jgi:hypothetical protein